MSREKGDMKELPEANKTQVPDVISLTGEQDRMDLESMEYSTRGYKSLPNRM